MAKVEDVQSVQEFDAAVGSGDAVVHFWAPWCEPCKHMDEVLAALASSCPPSARFLRVEAEEDAVVDLAERYEVSAVPHFLVFKDGKAAAALEDAVMSPIRCGKVAAAVEGADAAALTSAVTSSVGGASNTAGPMLGAPPAAGRLDPSPPPKRQPPPESDAAVQGPIVQEGGGLSAAGGDKAALTRRIEGLLASAPVLLFMKGSPDSPRCGFSAQVVQALSATSTDFRHFDILQDNAIREGLKEHSDWPTYPQLYVGGELLGGADIVLEMAAAGELKEALGEASAPQPDVAAAMQSGGASNSSGASRQPDSGSGGLQQRLQQLTTSAPVVLFMKGERQAPFCKFSKAAVAALDQAGVPYDTFDVFQGAWWAAAVSVTGFSFLPLAQETGRGCFGEVVDQDDEVREGLKDFSNWPTYPQLYAHGELVGGADIIAELATSGELKDALAGE